MNGHRDRLAGLRHEDLVSYLRTTFDVTNRTATADDVVAVTPADRVLA